MSADRTIYAELEFTLRERLAIIADREHYQRDAAGHLVRLQACSEKLNSLQRNLPTEASPKLAHFLERCSYDKALAFLESEGR